MVRWPAARRERSVPIRRSFLPGTSVSMTLGTTLRRAGRSRPPTGTSVCGRPARCGFCRRARFGRVRPSGVAGSRCSGSGPGGAPFSSAADRVRRPLRLVALAGRAGCRRCRGFPGCGRRVVALRRRGRGRRWRLRGRPLARWRVALLGGTGRFLAGVRASGLPVGAEARHGPARDRGGSLTARCPLPACSDGCRARPRALVLRDFASRGLLPAFLPGARVSSSPRAALGRLLVVRQWGGCEDLEEQNRSPGAVLPPP